VICGVGYGNAGDLAAGSFHGARNAMVGGPDKGKILMRGGGALRGKQLRNPALRAARSLNRWWKKKDSRRAGSGARETIRALVAGIESMGLRIHVANPAGRLWTLNAPRVPDGVDDAKVCQYLLEKRGMEIAGGFGPLAGKIFRIGLMGYGSQAKTCPWCWMRSARR
jgi:hypothetical protein